MKKILLLLATILVAIPARGEDPPEPKKKDEETATKADIRRLEALIGKLDERLTRMEEDVNTLKRGQKNILEGMNSIREDIAATNKKVDGIVESDAKRDQRIASLETKVGEIRDDLKEIRREISAILSDRERCRREIRIYDDPPPCRIRYAYYTPVVRVVRVAYTPAPCWRATCSCPPRGCPNCGCHFSCNGQCCYGWSAPCQGGYTYSYVVVGAC